MEWAYIFSLIVLLLALLHYYLTRTYRYWEKQSFPCIKGAVPGLGNTYPLMLMWKHMIEMYEDLYNAMPDCSMFGFYDMRRPTLLIRDPELVKTVLVKEFHSFHSTDVHIDPELDPLLAGNPFGLNGARWKAVRQQLSMAFSGARLKYMYGAIGEVCNTLTRYLNEKLDKNGGTAELELKELFSRYTADAVASAGFGVEGESFKGEKNGPFREIGGILFDPSFTKGLKQLIILFMPYLNRFLKLRFVPVDVDRFLRKVMGDAMELREKQGVERNDFLQLMMQFKKSGGIGLKDDTEFQVDTTSYAASFFIEGYETSSITLSFLGYQLASHVLVQQRLREEVNAIAAKHNGITYEAIQEMTYLDQVLSESLRQHPVGGAMQRVCTKEIDLVGSDGLTCHVTPGTRVMIPVRGLHMDPSYWTDPEKFDPERFSKENVQNRHGFVYLPFGEGPRICLGMRMAVMQIKAAIATIVRNYSLELSAKTKVPLQLDPNYLMASAKGGLWVHMKPL